MKTLTLGLITALTLTVPTASAITFYSTTANCQQEVTPPGTACNAQTSASIATANLTLNTAQTQLTYDITSTGIDFARLLLTPIPTAVALSNEITVMHFHVGAFGLSGPVAFDLVRGNGTSADAQRTVTLLDAATFKYSITGTVDNSEPFSNSFTFASFVSSLDAGNVYLNIHSGRATGGEIRGQLATVPEPTTVFGMVSLGLWAASRKVKKVLS